MEIGKWWICEWGKGASIKMDNETSNIPGKVWGHARWGRGGARENRGLGLK